MQRTFDNEGIIQVGGVDTAPLTVGELYEYLHLELCKNAKFAAAIVTYGTQHGRVAGGYTFYRQGVTVLNLAPLKLAAKGGF